MERRKAVTSTHDRFFGLLSASVKPSDPRTYSLPDIPHRALEAPYSIGEARVLRPGAPSCATRANGIRSPIAERSL